jgi:hypothetical protein
MTLMPVFYGASPSGSADTLGLMFSAVSLGALIGAVSRLT